MAAAIIFLVLLRLAIGWHFFFEGVQKVQSVSLGETTTNRPFSSAGYFREAPGPAGGMVRVVVGDPDAEALAVLIVEKGDGDKDADRTPPHEYTPTELKKQWGELLAKYQKHYDFDESQKKAADAILHQAEDTVVLWLTQTESDADTAEQTRKFPGGEVKRRMATAERIKEYQDRLTDVRSTSEKKLWLFGRDVEKAKLRQSKAELVALADALMTDLDRHTLALKGSLYQVAAPQVLEVLERLDGDLTKAKKLADKVEKDRSKDDNVKFAMKSTIAALTTLADARTLHPRTPEKAGAEKVKALEPAALADAVTTQSKSLLASADKLKQAAGNDAEVKELADSVAANSRKLIPLPVADRTMERIDWLTMWGLTVIGGCLILGLFSRTNAWLAAGFLLMTYLMVPPWPWLPSVGPSEGNYLFVNKNLIEMLALCVLGCTATGRWFGVDAIFHWIWTSRAGEKKT